MAHLIWTVPALQDLDELADYISLDKPQAAKKFVKLVFEKVELLGKYSLIGSKPEELKNLPVSYRQLIVKPCRVIYRLEKQTIYIVAVIRGEKLLTEEFVGKRNISPDL